MILQSYTLECPIEYTDGGKTFTVATVQVQRPKGKHLRRMDRKSGQMAQALEIIGAVCDLPTIAVDEMDLADISAIQAILAPFLPNAAGQTEPMT